MKSEANRDVDVDIRNNVQYVNELSQLEIELNSMKTKTQDETVAEGADELDDVDKFLETYQDNVNGKEDEALLVVGEGMEDVSTEPFDLGEYESVLKDTE